MAAAAPSAASSRSRAASWCINARMRRSEAPLGGTERWKEQTPRPRGSLWCAAPPLWAAGWQACSRVVTARPWPSAAGRRGGKAGRRAGGRVSRQAGEQAGRCPAACWQRPARRPRQLAWPAAPARLAARLPRTCRRQRDADGACRGEEAGQQGLDVAGQGLPARQRAGQAVQQAPQQAAGIQERVQLLAGLRRQLGGGRRRWAGSLQGGQQRGWGPVERAHNSHGARPGHGRPSGSLRT